MNAIFNWADGNPGALTFLMELLDPRNTSHQTPILLCLTKYTQLRGTKIYVLWSDLCDRDITKVEELCVNCPGDVLLDACSRQDYSGRALVSEYLK